MMFRSTKGASKQRRDLMNAEITQIRDLLPLPDSARQRLSQHQVISLACCYIRKNLHLGKLFGSLKTTSHPDFEFAQAMSGFLLVLNKEGKLLYISENVTDFLGHSMVDMLTQGDSVYDIVDRRDHACVQSHLSRGGGAGSAGGADEQDRTFFCRMNVARCLRRQGVHGDHKMMHVRGHFEVGLEQYGQLPVFVATVAPLVTPDLQPTLLQNNTNLFQSVHCVDMRFQELALNGEFHLGYTEGEVKGHSWYEFIHPEDLAEAKEKHSQLLKTSHELGCMLTVRLQTASFTWRWVNIVMYLYPTLATLGPLANEEGDRHTEHRVVCINQVIEDSEVSYFKTQCQHYSSHIARSPELLANASLDAPSPQHAITHVAMETAEPYTAAPQQQAAILNAGSSDYGSSMDASPGLYFDQNTDGSFLVVNQLPGNRSSLATPEIAHSLSEGSGSESCDSWKMDQKPRLKRKSRDLSTLSPRQQKQACRESKKPRFSALSEGGGRSIADTLSFFGSELYKFSGGPGLAENGMLGAHSSDGSLLLQLGVHEQPVYVQLKGGVREQPSPGMVMLSQGMMLSQLGSPGPLTPISPANSDVSATKNTFLEGGLTIQVPDRSAVDPASLLTPDASPAISPASAFAYESCASEQCVPSFLDHVAETLGKQGEHVTLHREPAPQQVRAFKLLPSPQLPELDALCIESFFGTLSSFSKSLTHTATTPTVATPQQQRKQQHQQQQQQQQVLLKRAPVVIKKEVVDDLDIADEDMKALLADGELVAQMEGVADFILNMAAHGVNDLEAALTQLPSQLIVPPKPAFPSPGRSDAGLDVASDDSRDDDDSDADFHDDAFAAVTSGHDHMIRELQQLSQLSAGSQPIYGDDDFATAVFNQNL